MKEQAVRQAKDLLITVLILTAATGIGNIFWYFSFTKNIISVFPACFFSIFALQNPA